MILTIVILVKKSPADDISKYFSYFSQKIGFGLFCKLETICMEGQNYYLGKIRKNAMDLLSAEFVQKAVLVKSSVLRGIYWYWQLRQQRLEDI